jgi:NAD(P)-dependent dehydrogenase (short-subunit alcohol dehydrogenase family)
MPNVSAIGDRTHHNDYGGLPVLIEGSVAIVTGAGSGIGAALAHAFAAAGSRVVVGDIDVAGAHATAEQITGLGLTAVAIQADASVRSDIRAMIGLAATRFGPVDIYVANAGIGGPPGLGMSDQDWDRVLEVNLRAHVRAAALLMPYWVERGSGYWVSTASAAGLLTQFGAAAYAVSKHAVVGFAEWLAITYGDDGIGVSCVCPMGVNTALLRTAARSSDATERLTFTAITQAAEVVEPELVAELTVQAVREAKFLVLPHREALDLYRQKGEDYERWISDMRRYQQSLPTISGA